MGWAFRVSEFCFFFLVFYFCQVWLQQESILFGLLKFYQACLELVAGGLAGGWAVAGAPAGWLAGIDPVGLWGGGLVGFRVPKFQFSLVLCLSQACLQHLIKVPDSQSLCCLCLCPSHHFGSSSLAFKSKV
jgi:hypothetical protein